MVCDLCYHSGQPLSVTLSQTLDLTFPMLTQEEKNKIKKVRRIGSQGDSLQKLMEEESRSRSCPV